MDRHWPHDKIVEELEALFETGATRESLAMRLATTSALSPEVVALEASPASKARALEAVLREAIRQRSDGTDTTAEHLRAANELLGWTTKNGDEIRALLVGSYEFGSKTLSELKTVDLTSLGVRSILAGAQFSKPLTSQRAVRTRRPQIAKRLADSTQDILEDKAALCKLSARFHEDAKIEGHQPLDKPTAIEDKVGRLRRRLIQRAAVITGILAGGVVVGAITTALVVQRPLAVETLNPGGVQAPQPTLTTPAPFVRQAEVRYTEGKGLNTFVGPGNTYPRGNPWNLDERQVIAVVCQERNGQPVHDPLGDAKRYMEPWPVWDKLSNELWVSDLYTDLPKVPGDRPPDGIPRC